VTTRITAHPLPIDAFPLLNGLALTDEELSALTRQGFIRGEKRGQKTVFRLRFRVDGRQRARYVSRHHAVSLGAELALLQKRVRAHRRVTRLAALARQALRHRRLTLAPILEMRGLHFHGHQIRRRRKTK
jgi:hypothetical protein